VAQRSRNRHFFCNDGSTGGVDFDHGKLATNIEAGRCAPSAVPLVDDVVETSEMARQNGKELSYPQNRQDLV
jgi:hypothetical protein